jgi:hypothetical protein
MSQKFHFLILILILVHRISFCSRGCIEDKKSTSDLNLQARGSFCRSPVSHG